MTVSLLRFRFALTALILAPLFSNADTGELAPVTVTGTRIPATAGELPTGTVILEREDIEKMPVTSLADVLDTVAGANTSRFFGGNGSKASVSLLGTGSKNTLILLNGQRFSNVDLSEPDLQSIPLAAIERIEVLPGAGAALYGNGVVGGVINIVTRNRYEQSAGASLSRGDFNSVEGEGHGTFSTGNLSGAASFNALNSEAYRDNNEIVQRNGFGDLRHHSELGTFFISMTAEDQQLELPGGRMASFVSDDTEFENDPEGASNPEDEALQETWTVNTGAVIPLNDTLAFKLDISRRGKDQISDVRSFGIYRVTDVTTRGLNPRLVFTGATGAVTHDLTLGWDEYRYDFDTRSAGSEAQIDNPSSRKKIDQTQRSWYLHDVLYLGDKWSLTLGARQLSTETDSKDLSASKESRDSKEEMYEGGIRYHINERFSLFGGAQRSVRLLNADEIQPEYNATVLPQTGRHYTLGAGWKKQKQHSTLTLWRARLEKEIVFDPSADGNPFSFCCNVNSEHPTLRKGASLNSRWQLEDDLFVTLNASYQRGKFEAGPNEGNEMPEVPRQTGYLRADYQALDWLRLSLAHRYVGKRYLTGDGANASRRLPSYRMSDAIARAEWSHGYLEFGAYNFTDELASDIGFLGFTPNSYSAYPLPERHYRVGIGVKL